MASNKHGNNNENEIVNYLDGKKIKDLNPTMKNFIKFICQKKNILCKPLNLSAAKIKHMIIN